MKLQIESIDIKEIKIGSETSVSNHVLNLNPKELEDLILKDDRIDSVLIDMVSPGERVRIINIVDIIQPRCKVDQEEADFPGWLGKLTIAGQGRTRSLRGLAVVLSNSVSKREYSSILDMFELGSELSKYGKMEIISIHPLPSENVEERDFEEAVKLAGLKTAVYLARSAKGQPIDQTEVFDLPIPNLLGEQKAGLPKVAYYHMLHTPQHDYQGIGDPIFYGTTVTDFFPTIIHPNEIIDGGVINTHTLRGMDTFSLQNHQIIKELYKRHGKELIFVGVVAGVASIEHEQRKRYAMLASHLISHVLGADGVILNKIHGGMPHVDLGLLADDCEKLGVKTTLFIDIWQTIGALNDAVLFSSKYIDAIVNRGNIVEKIQLSQAKKILGGTAETIIYHPDFKQKAGDKMVEIEGMLYAGAYAFAGEARIIGAQY